MLTLEPDTNFLQRIVLKNARDYSLEGIAHVLAADTVKIVVCGKKRQVDSFVEALENESLVAIAIEPFVKDKDYRGVIRIID